MVRPGRAVQIAGIISLAAVLAACTLWGQPRSYTWKNAPGAEDFERLFWKAVQEQQWEELEHHLASNFLFVGEGGVMGKREFLADLKRLRLLEYSLGEVEVVPQGNDHLVTYVVRLKASRPGTAPVETTLRYLTVWQQLHKGGWIMVAQSQVPVKTSAPTQGEVKR